MKSTTIITLVCLASCINRSKEEVRPEYNKASLKAFAANVHLHNGRDAINQLDSTLGLLLKDSLKYHQSITYLETLFSNPNTLYRNELLYSKLLQAKVASPWYNSYEKKIAVERLKLLQQNNIGNPANDFIYTTPAGYKRKMYDIKSSYTLLYFINPECNACKEMKTALSSSPIINQKLKTKELTILSIYTDSDERLWLNHLNEYPSNWLQGRDQNEYLYKNNIYDLRAIPTIYLLDSNKKVERCS